MTRPGTRSAVVVALAIVLAVFAFFYRFNALGGALGGFDNDHFVSLAYAKQVEAGERPLRDFMGTGLQGAWPSLSMLLPAWAQATLGDTLRSEALLTVSALTLTAVLTFVAALRVSPMPVAFAAAVLSVLMAPKLYSYPKVLMLAAILVAAAAFVRRPRPLGLSALALLTVVAFFFRHDLAAYVGVASVAAVLVTAERPAGAVKGLGLYGAIMALCLLPSLWQIHSEVGLGSYVEDSLFSVREEARRTSRIERGLSTINEDGERLTPLSFFADEQNGTWWLYRLNVVLPVAVLAAAFAARWRPRFSAPHVLIPCAAMALLTVPAFLRGNTGARLGDLAPVTAVLLAGVVALAWRATSGVRGRPAILAVSSLLLVVTVQSVWAVGNAKGELDTSGWSDSIGKIVRQANRRWEELGALPAAYWNGDSPTASLSTVQYLHACTSPSDRLIVLSYQPDLLVLSDRRAGGAGGGLVPGLLFLYRNQEAVVRKWKQERVPIVLMQRGPEDEVEVPILLRYLRERYREAGTVEVDNGRLAVFADRGLTPTRAYGAAGLPCFREP